MRAVLQHDSTMYNIIIIITLHDAGMINAMANLQIMSLSHNTIKMLIHMNVMFL